MSIRKPLHEELALFRKQSTDLLNTIQRINDTLSISNIANREPQINTIISIVCDYFEVSPSIMSSRVRTNTVTVPRHIALYLCRLLTKNNLIDIARAFRPDMDHGTVLHAWNSVQSRMSIDKKYKETVLLLTGKCTTAIEDIHMPLFAHAHSKH